MLICDEPTSALDPIGRKEILDILLAVRQQTTVMFSTHILSDVERICTDVAFLQDGRICLQGKLSEIRSLYRTDRYVMELERQEDISLLQQNFAGMQRQGEFVLTFSASDHDPAQVLQFVARQNMPLTKWERLEPTLESVFMEVMGS